ncbi:MAG: helix-turn-helix domain-containing protein [Clostridia bacterium]|nr:helix-turn-helix domain-containing protein [Clostridia bacterium]
MSNFYNGLTETFISDATSDIISPFVSLHYHNSYEMYYLLKGERVYFTNNTSYPLQEDCITLTKPSRLHGTRGSVFSRILINFDAEYLKNYFNETFLQDLLQCFSCEFIPSEKVRSYPELKSLFFKVNNAIQKQDFLSASLELVPLLTLLKNVTRPLEKNDTDSNEQNIESIWKYIDDNLASIENISQIAEHFHFSKYYFCHFFKKRTGLSIMEYICSLRIQQAEKLLANTNKTIEEIAFAVGFKDRSYFCLTFKKRVGIPPSTYRRTYKNSDDKNKKLLLRGDLPQVNF